MMPATTSRNYRSSRINLITALITSLFLTFNVATAEPLVSPKTTLNATNAPLKFSHLTTKDGLSNSNVFGITQDHQGFIWFATEDGLNRYDGINFITYRHNTNDNHSLADNVIRKIFIDSNKTLWVGTENGLSRYNLKLDNFDNFTHKTNDDSSLRDNVIWDIFQDKAREKYGKQQQGLLWVSTTNGLHTVALDEPDKEVNFKRIDIRSHNEKFKEIKTIFQDNQHNYWFGSFDNGIQLISKNLTYIGSLQQENKFDLNINANALFDVKVIDNQYWLATDNGLFIVSDDYQLLSHITSSSVGNKSSNKLLSNNIRAIAQYDDTHVWVASHEGLNTINLLDDSIQSYQKSNSKVSLSDNWLMDIFQDNNGNMWLASYGGGLSSYSPLTELFHHDLSSDNAHGYRVESFAETSDGIIWLSTEQNGLFQINKKNQVTKVLTGITDSIRQILVSNDDTVWIRTGAGKLINFFPKENNYIEHKNWILHSEFLPSHMAIIQNTNIWYINKEGELSSYNTVKEEFKSIKAKDSSKITSIQMDENELIWLTTNKGSIYKFDILRNSFQEHQTNIPAKYIDDHINKLIVSKDFLYLASDSQGIAILDRNKKTYKIYNKNSGLKNNYISSIIKDSKDNLWVASNAGISYLDVNKKSIFLYGNDFSINSPEFIRYSSFKSNSGRLFFGSPNGFYSFTPEEPLKVKQSPTSPIFTNLLIANKKIDILPIKVGTSLNNDKFTLTKQLNSIEQLNLAYNQSPISFEFSSPNPKLPSQLFYKYRLLELEQDWIDAATESGSNNNRAVYTNLSAGDYVFEVQAYDLNHPEQTKTSRLNVRILPPWWLSTSAIIFYSIITLLFFVYVIQQFRNKQLYNSQIKESEERLKLSLWGSGDEMWDWNIKTDKVYHTNTWSNLAFPQDSTRNANAKTNIHHQDLTRVKESLSAHLKDNSEHFEATYRVKDKNGQWIWILDRGKIVERDEFNAPTRMTGTLKDISHIKKAEERLKLFARCIQNISDAVVIYDRQFITVDVNKAFQRITGKSKSQMLGRTMSFSQYPSSFGKDIKKHLLTKGSWHGEVESLRANGSKYLTDLNIDVIHDDAGIVSHFVGVFSDISKRKETEAELRKLASSDTLTGLPNRSFFQANQARLVKNDINHALLVFDLDNFKKINDSMGHQVGDEILCQVANRMLALGRQNNTVYRLGGDEFSIIIEGTNDIHTITSLAKDILKNIALPYKLKNQEIVLYSSIGIVLFPEDGNSGHELLKNADTAMYHAKGSGGNKYQFFSDSMNKQAVKRLQIENLIRHGLKEDSFSVFYQPKIEIATGKIAGMEALVRFETPSKGVISPVVFIPVSEETGQIIDIGEVVLRKSCFATKKWVDAGLFDGRVAVNLSAVQFTQTNLVGQIADILKESGLPAKHLELEITEGTVMDSPQAAIDTMLQIRAMGVHLSLDDFGTGYSSLAYLKKFPLNTLKIDKAFVDDIEISEQGRNMVATIVTIAHNLGMDVVAEGVETNQQLSFLSGLQCELLQGYLYSKPLPTEQFQQYLLAHQIANESTSFNMSQN